MFDRLRRSAPAASRPSRRRKDGARGETGALAALEAVFIGMMLVSSIAIVSSMGSKAPSVPPARMPMEDMVQDILHGLENLPTSDRYMSQLERAIGQAVLGNTTSFESYIKRTLPTGTECRLWLDNGHARRLLAGASERLARESVGGSVLYHPTWAYSLVVPSLDVVSSTQALDVQGFGVSQGALVKEAGVPVVASVTTNLGTYDRAGITSIGTAQSVSLYLKNETGPTFIARDTGSSTQKQEAYNDTGNESLRPTGNFTVPANATLLNVTGSFTGDLIAYTVTLKAPNGTEYPYTANGAVTVGLGGIIGAAEGVWNVTASGSITGIVTPKKANLTITALLPSTVNFTVAVKEDAGVAIPEGAKLTFRMPWTFEQISATNTSQAGWRNIVPGKTTADGVFVTAELATPLSGAERTLVVTVAPPALPEVLYTLQADMTNGTSARASFLYTAIALLVAPDNPIQHGAYLSVPKPMAAGKNATWGLTFNTASLTLLGLPESLTAVSFRSPDGAPLWSSITPIYPATGWTLLNPGHVVWVGTRLVLANAAIDFTFVGTAHSATTPNEAAHQLPISYATGSNFPLVEQVRPYIFTGAMNPAASSTSRGYEVPNFDATGMGNATLGVEWYARGLRVAGNASYNVSTSGDLRSMEAALRLGLSRSHLTLSSERAKIGEAVTVTADFQGLLDQINVTVADSGGQLLLLGWQVETKVLDPLQGFTTRDKWQPVTRGNTTGAQGTLTYTPPPGDFYGPHAVVSEATFTIRNVTLGVNVFETVRTLGVIDVLPDGGQSEAALYWVSLECWLPDWQ